MSNSSAVPGQDSSVNDSSVSAVPDAAKVDPDIEQAMPSPDHYVEHLAEVNEEQDVVSTEEIRNERGVLIVGKGARIDRAVAQRVLKHKLVKPLEEQVQIERAINGDRLYKAFHELFQQFSDVKAIHDACDFDDKLKRLCNGNHLDEILTQKVTVLANQVQDEFQKALFCTWLATLIAVRMKLERSDVIAIFIASLVHDIGLLHIDPKILRKQGALEPAEWRAIQSHVIVGKLIVEKLVGINAKVAEIIFDHHENCNGTGYPVGKSGEDVSIVSQVVAMADSLQSIRMKQFSETGRTLGDAFAFLQMNQYTHHYEVYKTTAGILKEAGLGISQDNPFGSITEFAQKLAVQEKAIKEYVDDLNHLPVLMARIRVGKKGAALLYHADKLLEMVARSGMTDEAFICWLDDVESHIVSDENAIRTADQEKTMTLKELNELHIMQNELCWHLKNVKKTFDAFLEAECSQEHKAYSVMKTLSDRMGKHIQQFQRI